MTQEEKWQLNDKIGYCLEQLEESQKYLRDDLIKETLIFVENAQKQLHNVKFRLRLE